MARSLANQLTDTLYCLDEPSSGLHPRDSGRLLKILKALRSQGNTVVVVEHENTLIRGADEVLEIGPKAGSEGGDVTYQGKPRRKKTARHGSAVSLEKDKPKDFLTLEGVTTHNLKAVNLRFPVKRVTGICGVSGSGKSSAIVHTVVPVIAKALGVKEYSTTALLEKAKYKSIKPAKLDRFFQDVLVLSQGAIGRSTRSNIATYLGIYDEIRKTMAKLPESRKLGLKPGAFSFNVAGGRCENCKGLGVVEEEMSFLGDLKVTCPECNGKRFSEDVLSVKFNGKNIVDVLSLTVQEAAQFFFDQANVHAVLRNVVSLGMGYLTLGQNTSSFSGGEAQRLKILQILLGGKRSDRPSLIVLDEPSTGLSDSDVELLVQQIHTLSARGHTVLVVEHHTGVLAACDHLIELGPDAGPEGGEVIYEGSPKDVLGAKASLIAKYMS
jgi:excinuclease ABC subunit A